MFHFAFAFLLQAAGLDWSDLFSQVAASVVGMVGLVAFIVLAVNLLKFVPGLVPDGAAPVWVKRILFIIALAVFGWTVIDPKALTIFTGLDTVFGRLAEIGALVLGLIPAKLAAPHVHDVVRGVPLIGKSYTPRAGG